MRMLAALLASPVLLVGCTSSPRSQEMVRRSTAAVTRTVASDVKGAALGIRDGLRHDPNTDAVDVNTATKDKLQTLPGATTETTDRIIRNRPYKTPGNLLRRRVVSKAAYDKMKSRLVAR